MHFACITGNFANSYSCVEPTRLIYRASNEPNQLAKEPFTAIWLISKLAPEKPTAQVQKLHALFCFKNGARICKPNSGLAGEATT